MYIWDVHRLKSDLIARPLSDREQLPYVIVVLVLATLGSMANLLLDPNAWDIAGAVFSSILVVFGTIYLFRRNGGSSGAHFLQRYFAIGCVVLVRWTVIFIVAAIPLYAVVELFGRSSDETTGAEFAFLAIAELILYQRIGHHIHDVARQSPRPAAEYA